MHFNEFGRLTFFKFEQLEKQKASRDLTESGIWINRRDEHPSKQLREIVVTELGIERLSNEAHPLKHSTATIFTPSGIESNLMLLFVKVKVLSSTRKTSDIVDT
jgi:hypothetical protein